MPDPSYGNALVPGTLAQLSRFTRGWNDQMANFLLPLASQDIWYRHYDFQEEDALNADWAVTNSGGTSAADFAPVADGKYGAIIGDTGTSDNGSQSLAFDGAWFDAADNPGMLVRIKFDIITNMYFEATWSDPPTTAETENWTLDTPVLVSNGVTDIASVVVDTDATIKAACLLTDGTTDTVARAILGETSPGATPFVAAAYATVLLQASQRGARACINGNPGLAASLGSGPDTGVALQPRIIVGTRSTTAVFPTIDYITLWCNRN